MINLLPPEEKQKLLIEKQGKLAIILGITILIPLCCFILILVAIRFYILGEVSTQKANLEQVKKEYETADFLQFKDLIKKNDVILSQLSLFYKKEVYITQVLKTISTISRPKNLYFTDLAVNRDKNQKIKITIDGFSESRDDLLTFQKNIEATQSIKNATFAPQSWINPVNVTFYLTFEFSPSS
jgi:Tfp pilus assembly protein PilN